MYFINEDLSLRIIGTIALFAISFSWLFIEYKRSKKNQKIEDLSIKRFILITRDGEREKEWYAEGSTSFLIGKGTPAKEVDIELGDTHYNAFISNEHAVLNYSDGFWYIEDLNSFNGVGVKKRGEEYALRLKPNVSYKIDEGDIIYISKAKILVR
ncbi:MAG: FHA domain-containing protein [Defluviitaleaceae bacterium]|nr:FHA domain-containing protein [Defluviitaleaceae bacterium]